MPTPQPGIFALDARSHAHLEFDLIAPLDLGAVDGVFRGLDERGAAHVVVGLAPSRVADCTAVDCTAVDFTAVDGVDGFTMPGTQHDLWVWVSGIASDEVFDRSRAVTQALAPFARMATEETGYMYRDNRDMTGFIDGTANPTVAEAPEVAIIQSGPGAGGSVVLYQKWVHDLDRFETLSVAEQEATIGRTKPDSIEFDDERKPKTAHISRVVIEADGEELEIFRRGTPFGTVREHGLLFVAFSADQARLGRMLRRMAGAEDGVRDGLTHYSTPVTGSYYFVPPVEAIRPQGA